MNFLKRQTATASPAKPGGLPRLASFRDERYLPFEGAGLFRSEWKLEMPSEIRQFDYETISDVILHIRYTSRDGGKDLKDAAAKLMSVQIAKAEAAGMVRLFSVRHEFPSAWAKFKSAKIVGAVKTAELSLELAPEHYPFWSKGRLRRVKQADVVAKVSGDVAPVEIVENADGTDKKDTLRESSIMGLLMGELKELKPTSPVTGRKLFFKQNAMEDLWIAIAWQP